MRLKDSVFLFCVCVLSSGHACAGITVVQALEFGSWISKNNDSQHEVTINTSGTYNYDSAGFIEITAPQEGIVDLDGMAASTAITSVIVTQTLALGGGSPNFQMINLQETHPATTDGSGVAQITVGGTAQSSGDTTPYGDNTYVGTLQIQINF